MASQDLQGIKLFGKTITLHGNVNTETPKTEHIILTQNTTATKTEHIMTQTTTTRREDQKQSNAAKSDLSEKRPDKIIACPRCKSMETKFCYFNNYNVNQPRHFCKGCQRYWTAGGALRNVPVGAGRRKNKPTARIIAGDLVGVAGVLGPGGVHHVEVEGLFAEAHGGFRRDFPAKRLRCYSDGQSC